MRHFKVGDTIQFEGYYFDQIGEIIYIGKDYYVLNRLVTGDEFVMTTHIPARLYKKPTSLEDILAYGDDLVASIERADPEHLVGLTPHMRTAIEVWKSLVR